MRVNVRRIVKRILLTRGTIWIVRQCLTWMPALGIARTSLGPSFWNTMPAPHVIASHLMSFEPKKKDLYRVHSNYHIR